MSESIPETAASQGAVACPKCMRTSPGPLGRVRRGSTLSGTKFALRSSRGRTAGLLWSCEGRRLPVEGDASSRLRKNGLRSFCKGVRYHRGEGAEGCGAVLTSGHPSARRRERQDGAGCSRAAQRGTCRVTVTGRPRDDAALGARRAASRARDRSAGADAARGSPALWGGGGGGGGDAQRARKASRSGDGGRRAEGGSASRRGSRLFSYFEAASSVTPDRARET